MGGDEGDNRYMTMEDGSLSMEREQLSQMASRQITFIDHLEKARETTMLRELVDYAARVANNLLVPEGFPREMWRDLIASERFYVRMLDMDNALQQEDRRFMRNGWEFEVSGL